MATIALYADKINQMPELIKDIKKSITDYKSELDAFKTKCLSVDRSVCDLGDVISSLQASSQTLDEEVASLDVLNKNIEQFIEDTVQADRDVADLINKLKNEFYDAHPNLRPECEKHDWEKFLDGLASVGEWCGEHWKILVTVVLVVVAIALIATGVGGILGAMALGTLWGSGIGGVLGGIISVVTGGSFEEGAINGAFSGAIAGIISGGMGFAMIGGAAGVSAGVTLTFGQTLLIGGVSGMGASLLSDVGDIFIKGEDIPLGQVLLNIGVSGALGVAFAGLGCGLAKGFSNLKSRFTNPNRGKVEFGPPENSPTPENIADTKAYIRGCNAALKDGGLSPSGRVSTIGRLSAEASKAARAERATAAAAGRPYQGHAGHVPDTTWTGNPQPHSWLDLNPSVNSSLGRQARNYPLGYQPTKFTYRDPFKDPLKFNIFQVLWATPARPLLEGFSGD